LERNYILDVYEAGANKVSALSRKFCMAWESSAADGAMEW